MADNKGHALIKCVTHDSIGRSKQKPADRSNASSLPLPEHAVANSYPAMLFASPYTMYVRIYLSNLA
jgi:hypothetical protein